eukprot:CAMPEP_0180308972 /NCGR_PEP_ID=MMETSP0988-20121125/28810_1 /TAXON_ID=697907 /ORGANISM="non described non described, Strain CCMP2293" /LENGTH=83 /DNA_ID=CAMNT_0022292639 /DNA_START=76 /DNA_END=327 /DNA_ORIENTATION=-
MASSHGSHPQMRAPPSYSYACLVRLGDLLVGSEEVGDVGGRGGDLADLSIVGGGPRHAGATDLDAEGGRELLLGGGEKGEHIS